MNDKKERYIEELNVVLSMTEELSDTFKNIRGNLARDEINEEDMDNIPVCCKIFHEGIQEIQNKIEQQYENTLKHER